MWAYAAREVAVTVGAAACENMVVELVIGWVRTGRAAGGPRMTVG